MRPGKPKVQFFTSDLVELCGQKRCDLIFHMAIRYNRLHLSAIPPSFRVTRSGGVAEICCRIAGFGSMRAVWEPAQSSRCIRVQTRAVDAASYDVDLFHGDVTFRRNPMDQSGQVRRMGASFVNDFGERTRCPQWLYRRREPEA